MVWGLGGADELRVQEVKMASPRSKLELQDNLLDQKYLDHFYRGWQERVWWIVIIWVPVSWLKLGSQGWVLYDSSDTEYQQWGWLLFRFMLTLFSFALVTLGVEEHRRIQAGKMIVWLIRFYGTVCCYHAATSDYEHMVASRGVSLVVVATFAHPDATEAVRWAFSFACMRLLRVGVDAEDIVQAFNPFVSPAITTILFVPGLTYISFQLHAWWKRQWLISLATTGAVTSGATMTQKSEDEAESLEDLSFSNEASEKKRIERIQAMMQHPCRIRRGEILGVGSQACVMEAFDLSTGTKYALKISKLPSISLYGEAEMLSRITHPCIVQFYGFADWQDQRGILLECCDQGSLSTLLSSIASFLEEDAAKWFTKDIVDAASYLHRRGIVHQDIKPSNCLIKNYHIKLADFGASKGDTATKNATFEGTPAYMAPEALKFKSCSSKVDVWSIGCCVMEMLTFKLPVDEQNGNMDAVTQLLNLSDTPSLPAHLSEEAASFIEAALQIDPAHRRASCELANHPFLQSVPAKWPMRTEILDATSQKPKIASSIAGFRSQHPLLTFALRMLGQQQRLVPGLEELDEEYKTAMYKARIKFLRDAGRLILPIISLFQVRLLLEWLSIAPVMACVRLALHAYNHVMIWAPLKEEDYPNWAWRLRVMLRVHTVVMVFSPWGNSRLYFAIILSAWVFGAYGSGTSRLEAGLTSGLCAVSRLIIMGINLRMRLLRRWTSEPEDPGSFFAFLAMIELHDVSDEEPWVQIEAYIASVVILFFTWLISMMLFRMFENEERIQYKRWYRRKLKKNSSTNNSPINSLHAHGDPAVDQSQPCELPVSSIH